MSEDSDTCDITLLLSTLSTVINPWTVVPTTETAVGMWSLTPTVAMALKSKLGVSNILLWALVVDDSTAVLCVNGVTLLKMVVEVAEKNTSSLVHGFSGINRESGRPADDEEMFTVKSEIAQLYTTSARDYNKTRIHSNQ